MRLVLVVLAACSNSGGWKPIVWNIAPADPKAKVVEYEFPDGANGTEIVIAMLAQARESTGVSGFELQVGTCTRTIAVGPVIAAPAEHAPELERITLRVKETRLTCKRSVDQVVTPGSGAERPPTTGLTPSPTNRFGDAEMKVSESCEHLPISHVVTRYRFEVDHAFVPPDWAEVARFTGTRLAFGSPRCAGTPKNEIRAHFHTVTAPRPSASAAPEPAVAAIIELANRAEAAAAAKHPGEATNLAEQAIAAVAASDPMLGLDDAKADALAERIAAAQFFAIEIEVDTFLHHEVPAKLTESWAPGLGAEIDQIAKRYERIKDLVRLPVVIPWLKRGAARLASLHEHTATLLEASLQPRAAAVERARAAALLAASK
ncbi:MAG: hypothetical protein ABI867_33455 [Kofleriaceae bacterium]